MDTQQGPNPLGNTGVAGSPSDDAPPSGAWVAEIGILDEATGREFEALPVGGAIPIQGAGQSGLTAQFAIKLRSAEGEPVPRDVLLELSLVAVASGIEAQNDAGIPARLTCRDDGACYRLPMLVQVSHLAPEEERDGLEVEGVLLVRDPADRQGVLARATCTGHLAQR